MSEPSRGQGVHGSGASSYTEAQCETVCRIFGAFVGEEHPVSVERLSTLSGLAGRTVRAILEGMDGERFLKGDAPGGVFVCRYQEEAARYDHRARSQIRTMLRKQRKRRAFQQTLPHRPPA